jgi:hypothetical protein
MHKYLRKEKSRGSMVTEWGERGEGPFNGSSLPTVPP